MVGDTTMLEDALTLTTLILSSNHLSCDVATLKDDELLGKGEAMKVFLLLQALMHGCR